MMTFFLKGILESKIHRFIKKYFFLNQEESMSLYDHDGTIIFVVQYILSGPLRTISSESAKFPSPPLNFIHRFMN